MNKDEFFKSLLTDETRCVMSIAEINHVHSEEEDLALKGNIVAWLAYNLAIRIRTKSQYARAHFVITEYSNLMLEETVYQGQEDFPEAYEAYQGYESDLWEYSGPQIAREEFPDLEFGVSAGDL